jgi:hypothetical protein
LAATHEKPFLPASAARQLEADLERRADRVLFYSFPESAIVPDGHADAIHAIELEPGAGPIERRIDRFRQVPSRIARQILRGREPSLDLPGFVRELQRRLSVDAQAGNVTERDVGADFETWGRTLTPIAGTEILRGGH